MKRMNLDLFLSSEYPTNIWISERDIEVYVRKSMRVIGNTTHPCLDIGSVEVREERRGQGTFKAFLSRFEKKARELNKWVYVESILNRRLLTYLATQGYELVPGTSEFSPSMVKKLL
jgi:GNAT superfamily N-acetyltransferase